jgi:hypothetical protein
VWCAPTTAPGPEIERRYRVTALAEAVTRPPVFRQITAAGAALSVLRAPRTLPSPIVVAR